MLGRIPHGLLTENSERSFFAQVLSGSSRPGLQSRGGSTEIEVTHRQGTLVYLAWTFLTQLINPARWGGAAPYTVSLSPPVSINNDRFV